MWYKTINKIYNNKTVEVMRKDNTDGSFELCGIDWHNRYWNKDKKQHGR